MKDRKEVKGPFGSKHLIIVVLIVIVVVIGSMTLLLTTEDDEDIEENEIGMSVTQDGIGFRVDINTITPVALDKIDYEIDKPNGLVAYADDLFGTTILFEGSVMSINFNQTEYNAANIGIDNRFYSKDPIGAPPRSQNKSLFITFHDVDMDSMMTVGDHFFIHPAIAYKHSTVGFSLQLLTSVNYLKSTSIEFPDFVIDYSMHTSAHDDNHLVGINNTPIWPFDNIEYELKNPNGSVVHIMDPDGYRIWMDGSLNEVIFSESMFDIANMTVNETFYSRESMTEADRNRTLFIVLNDTDDNGKLSSGDVIFLRSTANGGVSKSGLTFSLTFTSDVYRDWVVPVGSITFPHRGPL